MGDIVHTCVLMVTFLCGMSHAFYSGSRSSCYPGPRYDSCREAIEDLKALLEIVQCLKIDSNCPCPGTGNALSEELITKLVNALIYTATQNCGFNGKGCGGMPSSEHGGTTATNTGGSANNGGVVGGGNTLIGTGGGITNTGNNNGGTAGTGSTVTNGGNANNGGLVGGGNTGIGTGGGITNSGGSGGSSGTGTSGGNANNGGVLGGGSTLIGTGGGIKNSGDNGGTSGPTGGNANNGGLVGGGNTGIGTGGGITNTSGSNGGSSGSGQPANPPTTTVPIVNNGNLTSMANQVLQGAPVDSGSVINQSSSGTGGMAAPSSSVLSDISVLDQAVNAGKIL